MLPLLAFPNSSYENDWKITSNVEDLDSEKNDQNITCENYYTENENTISSGTEFDVNYEHQRCFWFIEPEEEIERYKLEFENLNINGVLYVYDLETDEELIVFNRSSIPQTFYTPLGVTKLKIRYYNSFNSSDEVNPGWKLNYKGYKVGECPNIFEYNNFQDEIQLTGLESGYLPNQECGFLINLDDNFSRIQILFGDFSLGEGDSLKLYNGIDDSAPLLQTYTGAEIPENYITEHGVNQVYLKFTSDDNIESTGWKLKYFGLHEDQTCLGEVVLTEPSGIFTDGTTGNELYSLYKNCGWLISVENAERLKLNLKNYNISGASLNIYAGPDNSYPELEFYNNQIITEEGVNEVFVEFVRNFLEETSYPVHGLGWEIEYESIQNNCFEFLQLQTNNEPVSIDDGSDENLYQNNLHCSWLLTNGAPEVTETMLLVENLDLGDGDFVKIYSGNSTNGVLLETLEGAINNQIISNLTNETSFYMEFKTDASNVGEGWEITYHSKASDTDCFIENLFSENSGEFIKEYNKEWNCEWIIKPETTERIYLEFSDLQIGSGELEIYEVTEDGTESLLKIVNNDSYFIETVTTNNENNYLIIKSNSLNSYSKYSKWKFTYKLFEEEEACLYNEIINAENGTLSDGSEASLYENNLNCKWIIKNEDAYRFTLNFTEFDLKPNDFVKIYAGTTDEDPLIASYTGSSIPEEITTNIGQNIVAIYFITDASNAGNGWTLNFDSITDYCSNITVITENSGIIEDGSFIYPYDSANCSWLISPDPEAKQIQLIFSQNEILDVNSLKIYDGADEFAPLLEGIFDENHPKGIFTTTYGVNEMYIKFEGSSSTHDGWKGTFNTYFEGECNEGFIQRNNFGVISDGSFDGNYSNNYSCSWVIIPEGSSNYISFDFEEFDLGYGDVLSFYKGTSAEGELIESYSQENIPSNFILEESKVFVKFETDLVETASGWTFKYKAFEEFANCFGLTTLTDEKDSILIDNFIANNECSWLISPETTSQIRLSFKQLKLFDDETLTIYDGSDDNAPVLLTLDASSDYPENIYSSVGISQVFVKFTTYEITSDQGWWELYYNLFDSNADCFEKDLIYKENGSTGTIGDGSEDEDYDTNSYCQWLIQNIDNGNVVLEFTEFDLGEGDFLRVYDAANSNDSDELIGEFEGDTIPDIIESTGNALYVVFVSGDEDVSSGWKATYKTWNYFCIDSEILTEETGLLHGKSEIIQDYTYGDFTCSWLINPDSDGKIYFDVDNINLDHAELLFYDGEDEIAPLLKKYDEFNLESGAFVSENTDKVFVKFVVDDEDFIADFDINYELVEENQTCFNDIIELNENGFLKDGSKDENYQNDLNCSWILDLSGNDSYKIKLTFTEFDLGAGDSVKIYEGTDNTGTLINEFTGTEIPEAFITNSGVNKVYIEFETDASDTGDGWVLNYSKYSSSFECIGVTTFTEDFGNIGTSEYSSFYGLQLYTCGWLIKPENEGDRVRVYPKEIKLPENPSIINIYDGPDNSYPLLKKYENTTQNQDYFESSSGNTEVYIEFISKKIGYNTNFEISYYLIQEEECTENPVSYANYGVLRDGSGDENYENNFSCSWVISVMDINQLRFQFSKFDVASGDEIRIYEGTTNTSPLIATLTGNEIPEALVTSSGISDVLIEFETDDFENAQGWELYYNEFNEEDVCGGLVNLTEESGEILIDNENYNNIKCGWLIAPPNAEQIRIIPKELDFPSNSENYQVEFFDGPDDSYPLLGVYNKANQYQEVNFETTYGVGEMFVKYSQKLGVKWHIEYHAIYQLSYCQNMLVFTDESDTFSDGSSSETYHPNNSCTWLINPGDAFERIQLNLKNSSDFETGFSIAEGDHLYIYDGEDESAPLLQDLTNLEAFDQTFTSSEGVNTMFLKFVTNDSGTGSGWEADYTAQKLNQDCLGTVVTEENEGSIFYNLAQENDLAEDFTCEWIIDVPEADRIKINLNNKYLPNSYLKIYSGENAIFNNQIKTFYNNTEENVLMTDYGINKILIVYDNNNPSSYWDLEYHAISEEEDSCIGNQVFTADSGVFSDTFGTNHLNQDYAPNRNCTWLIKPEKNYTKLWFDRFEVEEGDFVNIYDGSDANAPLLASYTGNDNLNEIISSNAEGNIFVEFITDNENEAEGWKISYESTNEPENCFGQSVYYEDSGVINGHFSEQSCMIYIAPENADRIELKITFSNANYARGYIYYEDFYPFLSPYKEILSDDGLTHYYITPNNYALIDFRSYYDFDWEIEYGSLQNGETCLGFKEINEFNGILEDSQEDQYGNNNDCSWLISYEDGYVSLDFSEFSLDEDDYLYVYDGEDELATLLGAFTGNEIPSEIISSSSKVFINFKTNESGTSTGWKLKYLKVSEEGCTETQILTDLEGDILADYNTITPDVPGKCEWLLDLPGQEMISFNIKQWNLSYINNAKFYIYDGENEFGNLLAILDDNSSSSSINSAVFNFTSEKIFIVYKSPKGEGDDSVGATLSYEAYENSFSICNSYNFYTEASHEISKYSDIDQYDHNLNCDFIISVNDAEAIQIVFEKFNLASDDSLTIYDGLSDSSPTLGSFTGATLPEMIMSTSNEVLVKFVTNEENSSFGWKLEYHAILNENYCDGVVEISDSSGIITDGSGDENYLPNSDCGWLITSLNAVQVSFRMTDLDLNLAYIRDYVAIYDGPNDTYPLIKIWKGSNYNQDIVFKTSMGNGQMFVKFFSSESDQDPGFEAEYEILEAESDCQFQFLEFEEIGTLEDSSGSVNYTSNTNCSWVISGEEDEEYSIYFTKLDIGEGDTLKIYDGVNEEGELLEEYTSSSELPVLIENLNTIFIEWATDDAIEANGWEFEVNKNLCDMSEIFTSGSGYIKHAFEDNNYYNNEYCSWLIAPTNANYVVIDFKGMDVAPFDYLKVYDGPNSDSPLIGVYNGNEIPEQITSSSNEVFIQFQTNYSVTGLGWYIYYTSGNDYCDAMEVLTDDSGEITDGSGDEQYLNDIYCSWLISPDNAKKIVIETNEFDLDYNDKLYVYDGNSIDAPLIGTYSLSNTPPTSFSSSEGIGELYFVFETNSSETNSGWSFNYKTYRENEFCSHQLLTETIGVISDGSDSENYENNTFCSWLVIPETLTQEIFLEFSELNLKNGDILNIYKGDTADAPLVHSFTEGDIVDYLFIYSDKIYIEFLTDNIENASGWELNYISAAEFTSCIGEQVITENSGVIEDGSGDSNYGYDLDCTWIIIPSEGNKNRIEFNMIDLGPNDELLIYDGEDETAPLIYSLDETDQFPLNVETSDGNNKFYLKFITDNAESRDGWEFYYFTSTVTINVEEEELASKIKIYPNPSDGIITIENNLDMNVDVEVLNIIGTSILNNIQINYGSNLLDFSILDKGVYVLRFKYKGNSYSKKIIIQ